MKKRGNPQNLIAYNAKLTKKEKSERGKKAVQARIIKAKEREAREKKYLEENDRIRRYWAIMESYILDKIKDTDKYSDKQKEHLIGILDAGFDVYVRHCVFMEGKKANELKLEIMEADRDRLYGLPVKKTIVENIDVEPIEIIIAEAKDNEFLKNVRKNDKGTSKISE